MRLFCDHVSCCNINLLWNVVCGMHTLHQSQLEFFFHFQHEHVAKMSQKTSPDATQYTQR